MLRIENGAIHAHTTTSDIAAHATNGAVRITAVYAVAEVECTTAEEAVAWVERELPAAYLPKWAFQRLHGPAGVFQYSSVTQGHYTADDPPQW